MMPKTRVIFHFVLFVVSGWSAEAAEVLLKTDCRCGESVVRLGDVADLYDDDPQTAERLAQVELFPTPAVRRYLALEELKSILTLRGVKVADCSFRGSARVEILPEAAAAARVAYRTGPNASRQRAAQRRVEQAILEYLAGRVDEERPWGVQAEVTPEDTELIARRLVELTASGGAAPWTGRQEFDVTVKVGEEVTHRTVAALLSTPEMVVVARRPMRSGELIHHMDVELRPAPPNSQQRKFAYSIDEVAGKQLSRGYSQSQPIDPRDARAPQLVKQNDVVTVYAVTGGVRVRMLGRALESGARGDVIAIADAQTRKPLRSKGVVTGFQTVEIFALGPQATSQNETPQRRQSPQKIIRADAGTAGASWNRR